MVLPCPRSKPPFYSGKFRELKFSETRLPLNPVLGNSVSEKTSSRQSMVLVFNALLTRCLLACNASWLPNPYHERSARRLSHRLQPLIPSRAYYVSEAPVYVVTLVHPLQGASALMAPGRYPCGGAGPSLVSIRGCVLAVERMREGEEGRPCWPGKK